MVKVLIITFEKISTYYTMFYNKMDFCENYGIQTCFLTMNG